MFAKKYLGHIALFALTLVLFLTNLTPGTYLTGWDNLQTDLNPALGIKRAFFAAWQEYQSLGLAAGMSHGADLVRAIGVFLASFILPESLIRYTFHILMLLVGGLGMLKLLTLLPLAKQTTLASFIGAVFYMLNFATMQMFFLPFEPFSAFFASLPWLIWIFLTIMTRQTLTKRDWIMLFIINLLATPSFVLQQLFAVYGITLAVLGASLFLQYKPQIVLKRLITSGVLILAINSFWLLPQVYFLKTEGAVVRTAKINQLATDDVFYSNKDKGSLTDFLTMTSFLTDRQDQFKRPLFATWNTHRLGLWGIISLGVVTAIWLFGILLPSRFRLPFTILFGIVSIALLANTQPFSFLNELIRGNTLVNQIFRSPFTKFSMLYALIASYFLTIGTAKILSLLARIQITKRILPNLTVGILVGILLLNSLPAFMGQLFSPVMKTTLPQAYKEAFSYFNTVDKNKRIALLPDYTFWGWFYHDWGYNGSGFVWYGIEQPIMSRTFDVWSLKSESYFWEQKHALESENLSAFENVLEKYQIDYLLFDESMLPVVATTKSMQQDRILTLLAQSDNITKIKTWERIHLYQVTHDTTAASFLSAADQMPNVGPSVSVTNADKAYEETGLYQVDESSLFDSYYPFLDLTTQTHLANKAWNIQETTDSIRITRDIPFDTSTYALSTTSGELDFIASEQNETRTQKLPYTIEKRPHQVSVSFPKVDAVTFTAKDAQVKPCSDRGTSGHSTLHDDLLLTAERGGSTCASFVAPTLSQQYGYLMKIRHEHKTGQPLFFYVQDLTKEQAYIEDRLTDATSYYVIGSRFPQGIGYDFAFQNTSFPTIPAKNTIQDVSLFIMPYDVMKSLSLVRTETQTDTKAKQVTAIKNAYHSYTLTVTPETHGKTLILWQAYQPGWNLYATSSPLAEVFPVLFGERITTHTTVNNWANGWNLSGIPEGTQLRIFYTPQLLTYVGMVLAVAAVIFLLLKKDTKREDK